MMNDNEFAKNIEAITPKLRSQALRLTNNAADADDLVQDAIFRMLKKRELFEEGTNLNSWAFTILRNLFINKYRRVKKYKSILSEKADNVMSLQPRANNLGESNMEVKELMKLVNNLNARYREPFMMYYQGFSYNEIVEALEIPIGTVKSRIHHARKALQAAYKQSIGLIVDVA